MRYLRDVDVADAVLGVTIHDGWMVDLTEITMAIASIPTADVSLVKHGRWKLHEDGSGTCQECGCRQKYVWDMDGWQNYCGHCGADMRNGGKEK